MTRLTNEDRRLAATKLAGFLGTKPDLPLHSTKRAQQWADGFTMREIAESEGVSTAAVQVSIRQVVDKFKAWLAETA